MMDHLIVIFTFVLIATSICLGVGSWFYKRHLDYKERKDALDRDHATGGSTSSSEVAELKERVQVLERLATDRGQLLADEIEQLRGPSDTKEPV